MDTQTNVGIIGVCLGKGRYQSTEILWLWNANKIHYPHPRHEASYWNLKGEIKATRFKRSG
jgi:hypothetical protein